VSKKKISLKELDVNNIGSWPQQAKLGFSALIALLIIGLAWYLFVSDKKTELEGTNFAAAGELMQGLSAAGRTGEAGQVSKSITTNLSKLRGEFETKQGRAANLEPLKQQLAQMEQQLQQMLRQLPSKTEMPDLIVDISQTALATGISNELFQPGPEQPKEFYAEKPIALRMVGTYHQFGAFVSGVASLPRVVIMTMHDISLKPRDAGKDGKITANSALELAGTVKTYRYLDEEEMAEQQAAADAAAKQGGA